MKVSFEVPIPPGAIDGPESLTAAEMKLQGLIDRVAAEHGGEIADVEEYWSDHILWFRFTAKGRAVKGNADLFALRLMITLDVDLPWYMPESLARSYIAPVQETIRQQVGQALA